MSDSDERATRPANQRPLMIGLTPSTLGDEKRFGDRRWYCVREPVSPPRDGGQERPVPPPFTSREALFGPGLQRRNASHSAAFQRS